MAELASNESMERLLKEMLEDLIGGESKFMQQQLETQAMFRGDAERLPSGILNKSKGQLKGQLSLLIRQAELGDVYPGFEPGDKWNVRARRSNRRVLHQNIVDPMTRLKKEAELGTTMMRRIKGTGTNVNPLGVMMQKHTMRVLRDAGQEEARRISKLRTMAKMLRKMGSGPLIMLALVSSLLPSLMGRKE